MDTGAHMITGHLVQSQHCVQQRISLPLQTCTINSTSVLHSAGMTYFTADPFWCSSIGFSGIAQIYTATRCESESEQERRDLLWHRESNVL